MKILAIMLIGGAMMLAGGSPDEVRLASFREHAAGMRDATDRARATIACAVRTAAADRLARKLFMTGSSQGKSGCAGSGGGGSA